ncbi:MAG: S-layer homology domain-containing protein [Oscillibacter sp.]|nr:S-layer homology domain-containing protein [Oscillibacter sp.]
MRRNRMIRVLVLALLLAAALCLPAGAFNKEPASWAAAQCKHLEDVGLLDWQIYTGGKAPDGAINRGDFCQMLVNLVQMEGDWEKLVKVNPVSDGYFTDAASPLEAYGMYYGAAYGITEGSTKNGQRVADARSNLTREQAAKMMCAAIDALETYGGVPAPQEGAEKSFTDQGNISSWAADSVARAARMGILQGDTSGKFNPKGTLTWQEACVMVDRLYTAAEPAVKARRAQQGIFLMDTAFELDADKYIRQSSYRFYALENNGQRSVLFISSDGIKVETYNADGTSAGIKTISAEMKRCGGFCEGENNYYLAFGEDNMEENNSKTVYRIVKYDKNWNRVGAADISNCYTTIPFDFTSHTAMAEENGILILHTSRQRYLTPKDGLRHQSNFTAKIRTSDMAVIYQSDNFDEYNYTSHSFAQYVAFDGGTPIYVDHGDAHPRGFNLSKESSLGRGAQQNFFSFFGTTGDNTTNAIPGGLGVSGSNYLFAAASSPQQGNDSLRKANVFLAVIPKSGGQAQIKWLTSLPGDQSAYVNDVKLVEVNNNTFVVMWQVTRPGRNFYKFDELQYAVFDGQGNQVGETRTLPGYVAPSTAEDPSVYGSKIVWARAELEVSDAYSSRKNRYIQIFELDIDANGATAGTPSTGTPSTGMPVVEKMKYLPETLTIKVGERHDTFRYMYGTTGGASFESSNESVAYFDGTDLIGVAPGTTMITLSVKLDNKVTTGTCQVTVVADSQSQQPETPIVEKLKYLPETLTIKVGETHNTFGYLYGASGSASFESSNESVAYFDGTDLIGAAPGTTTITLSVKLDNKVTTGTCRVTVVADSQSQQPGTPSEQTGEVEYVKGVICTKLPADGVVTSYREEQLNGDWLQLDVVGGDTVRLTGMKADDFGGRYNYVVLRAFGVQEDTPFTAGVNFSVSAKVNAAGLAAFYEAEGKTSMLTALICQNYRPGDSAMGGTGFSGADQIALIPDGNGGIAFRVTRR